MEVTTYAKFDGISEEIKLLLNKASDSVRICVAWLSLDIYRPIIIGLLNRDVDVHLIVNHDVNNQIELMKQLEGLKFKPLMMRMRGKLMHNKFCIIDDRIVITGSYNWSANAEGHFENIIVVKNDLPLVKQFRHEFEDLSLYHTHEVQFEKCHCKSILFNIGIFGYEQGKYNDSTVRIWSVCTKYNHVEFLGERYEYSLHAQLGMTDERDGFENSRDSDFDVPGMRSAFAAERTHRDHIQSYFSQRYAIKVHGIGIVECTNADKYHKGYDSTAEFVVSIPFRDAYFRKIVPNMLDENSGEVYKIIDMQKPVI